MPDGGYAYVGSELEIFAEAANWRAYWQAQVRPYLGRRVLEVGAGIGSVTRTLCAQDAERWVALEPDSSLAGGLRAQARAGDLPAACEVRAGTTADLGKSEVFDSVLYIDVLEHIKDDRKELVQAAQHLVRGGHLIVLAPAHRALFTAFDAAIGHYRRYGRTDLVQLVPPGTSLLRARYLDSVGMLASLANRFFLRSSNPTVAQIRFWDRAMVRVSRLLDPILGFCVGKSVLVVWRKD